MKSKSRNMNGGSGVELSSRCIEELASRTAELVCDGMARQNVGRTSSYKLIGTREAAEVLGISVRTLRLHVDEFPHIVWKGRYYFRSEELEGIVVSGNLENVSGHE